MWWKDRATNSMYTFVVTLISTLFFTFRDVPDTIAQGDQLFSYVDIHSNPLDSGQAWRLELHRTEKNTIGLQVVQVNRELLSTQESITLNLFPGKAYVLLKQRKEARNTNEFTFTNRHKYQNQ